MDSHHLYMKPPTAAVDKWKILSKIIKSHSKAVALHVTALPQIVFGLFAAFRLRNEPPFLPQIICQVLVADEATGELAHEMDLIGQKLEGRVLGGVTHR